MCRVCAAGQLSACCPKHAPPWRLPCRASLLLLPCCRFFTAVALWQLHERRLLDVDAPVVEVRNTRTAALYCISVLPPCGITRGCNLSEHQWLAANRSVSVC